MKRITWIAALVVAAGLLAWGGRRIYIDCATRWFVAYNISYDDGDEATARIYAERLAWISREQSTRFLAKLDITRAIRLEGADKRKTLASALQRLQSTFPDEDEHRYQGIEFEKAFLEAELGHPDLALKRVHGVCKESRSGFQTFDQCMQSIAPEGVYMGRDDALEDYEDASLALKLGIGDPAFMRFQIMNALRLFDLDRARRMRADMIREGIYTKHMQALYCQGPPIRLGAYMCTDYTAK